MTGIWVSIAALAVATAVLKLAGPMILGSRPLPPRAIGVVELLAAALLAALVVVETLGKGRSLTIDPRALGVAFAAIVLAKRKSVTTAVVGAAVVAGIVRALA
jgi:uncharacterized membrane protein